MSTWIVVLNALILIGLVVSAILASVSEKLLSSVIALLIFITNPVGAHAIVKGAYRHGIRPEKPMEVDDFRRDFDE